MKENNFQVLILAAGKGRRMMVGDLPKVLVSLKGKPMISYLLDAIRESGICDKPAIVIGYRGEIVKKTLSRENYTYKYIFQEKLLGTGHSVQVAKKDFIGKAEYIMVFYGDHPLVSPRLIKKLADTHLSSGAVLTMSTLSIPDYNDWRSEFKGFGKIIRSSEGEVMAIVEVKDATPEELTINELNVGYYCFKAEWLWNNIEKLSNDNAQGEYYLTDLVKMAVDQGHKITSIDIKDFKEALGVNSPEQLKTIENLL